MTKRFLCGFLVLPTLVLPTWALPLAHVPLKGAPAIANGVLFDDDWNQRQIATKRFTAQLQQKFPPGYDESKMVRELLNQGFRYPPPPKPGRSIAVSASSPQ